MTLCRCLNSAAWMTQRGQKGGESPLQHGERPRASLFPHDSSPLFPWLLRWWWRLAMIGDAPPLRARLQQGCSVLEARGQGNRSLYAPRNLGMPGGPCFSRSCVARFWDGADWWQSWRRSAQQRSDSDKTRHTTSRVRRSKRHA